jgi:hypothetical protein
MNPKNRNGLPKVVDQTPQESLLPTGRPGLPKFPLEDRSDRLGDPPPTVFPAGEVTGPTTPVGGPGPSGTTPRGRDDALDTRLLPKPSMSRLGIVVGIGQQTPDGFPDQRRKQPRRALGPARTPWAQMAWGRTHTTIDNIRNRLAGRLTESWRAGRREKPVSPRRERLRNQGRLPQRGGHPMPHEPVECRMVRHRLQAQSGPQLGGAGQQVLQPPIVLPQILLHPQTRPQRRLGELLGRVLGPIRGQGRTGDLAVPAGQTSAVATVSYRDPIRAPPILSF